LTLHPHLRADENHRICLEVSLHRQRSPVHVVDTHFSLESAARLSNAQETVAFVNRVAGSEPVVLMGDLNAEPSSPEIRYLIEEGGFVDVWDVARPADRGFTYASFNPVRRIDFILVRNVPLDRVEARLVGTLRTDGVFPSDHLGIVADLPSL
jgi:endonuclease/exonuclease/phosphatase family metal-dependent hydrolase